MKLAGFTFFYATVAALKNGRAKYPRGRTQRGRNHQAHSKLASNYTFLNDRFGPVTPLKRAINVRHHDDALKRKRNQLLQSRRVADEECFSGVDVLFLRDVTGSFEGLHTDFDQIFYTAIEEAINGTFLKGRATYSLISFRDKPIPELGEEDDDCWQYHIGAQNDTTTITDIMGQLDLGGGWDAPENQFGATIAALNSPSTMPWRTSTANLPVVVMVTDAPPHFNDDGVRGSYPQLRDYDTDYDETEEETFCTEIYYPSAAHVRSQLLVNGTQYFTLLTGEADERTYRAWSWFNDYLGQSPAFVQYDSVANGTLIDWASIADSISQQIVLSACPSSSTTTAAASASETETITQASTISRRTIPPQTEEPEGDIDEITMDDGSVTASKTATTSEANAAGSTAGVETGEKECDECAPDPQVLIALMKRPKVLEINAVAATEST